MEHERSERGGAFVWMDDGKRLAQMTYTATAEQVTLDRTQVDQALRGKGAGRRLVQAAVDWARAEHKHLLPLCPFARSVFDKTPEYADVLAK